jgi:Lipocalin-like domain
VKEEMEMQVRARLLGTWELIEGKLLSDGTATDYDFSPQRGGGGILIYSPDGYMCATLSKQERARFSTDQIDGGTAEEKVAAYATYISYTGSFEVDEKNNSVTHLVKFASFPNFVGRSLKRYLVFSGTEGRPGDEVRLDTPPMNFGGKTIDSYLQWRKL